MRLALVLLLACGDNLPPPRHDAPAPSAPCDPSGTCSTGPLCGLVCCGPGEQCVNDTCMCGDSPGCTNGDTCSGAGFAPALACGSVCCGVTIQCPI